MYRKDDDEAYVSVRTYVRTYMGSRFQLLLFAIGNKTVEVRDSSNWNSILIYVFQAFPPSSSFAFQDFHRPSLESRERLKEYLSGQNLQNDIGEKKAIEMGKTVEV